MDLETALGWLHRAGLPFQWRTEPNVGGSPAILRPLNGQKLPLGDLEVAIAIPDVHLGSGNDIFSNGAADAHSARLVKLLQALGRLRDEVGANAFCAVQLGDWYDLFRAVGFTVQAQVHGVDQHYQAVRDAALGLPLLHCIGNHDAALYKNPRVTSAQFGIAQPLGSQRVMAFHGHDTKTLQTIQARDLAATIGLNFVNLVALLPIIGHVVDFAQLAIDDSFEEAWTRGNGGGDKPWPKAHGMPPAAWAAPWVARDDTAELVRAARGLEYLTGAALDVVLIGHSHRPGIASAWVTAERQLALVDVGSWTYGRAEIAIVTPDGIGLAALPVH